MGKGFRRQPKPRAKGLLQAGFLRAVVRSADKCGDAWSNSASSQVDELGSCGYKSSSISYDKPVEALWHGKIAFWESAATYTVNFPGQRDNRTIFQVIVRAHVATRLKQECELYSYFVSDEFKSSAQLSSGVFLAGLFIFVQELRFGLNYLMGIGTVVGLVRVSSGVTAGARIQGAALLGMCTWPIVISSALITVARQTHAYLLWLSIFAALWLAYLSIMRVLAGTLGYLLALVTCIVILEGQFAWPAHVLWGETVWGVVKVIWLSSAITVAVGCLVSPKSAREAIPVSIAGHFEFAGHALSGAVTNLMQPAPADALALERAHGGLKSLMDVDGTETVKQPTLQEYQNNRVDPEADHTLRYASGCGNKRTLALLPAMLRTKQLFKFAPFEPAWFGGCRIELEQWKVIFDELDILVNLIASLELHLEGHEPLLLEDVVKQAFGITPLPCFRLILATVVASAAAMAQTIRATLMYIPGQQAPQIATCARDRLQIELREVLQMCHTAWQRRPEHHAGPSLRKKQWQVTRKRMCLEVEPVLRFLQIFWGKQIVDTSIQLWKKSLPSCFGSRQKAWETLRQNRDFHFGIAFFCASTAALVGLLQASQNIRLIREWHSIYLAVAVVSTMQERVDYALVRGFFRIAMTSVAATLGFVVMLYPLVADNTYALSTITCTWVYLAGHFFVGPYKYGSFMASIALTALTFNQYSPVPGSHGSVQYYLARLCEYAIGISIAWVIQFLFPWFLAADALQKLGRTAEASTELVCCYVEAYLEDLRCLAMQAAAKLEIPSGQEALQSSQGFAAALRYFIKRSVDNPIEGRGAGQTAHAQPDAVRALNIKDVSSRIADPLAIQLQISREGVVWKHGPLVLPPIVKSGIRHLQVIVERTILVHEMVAQDAFLDGHFTHIVYETLFKLLEAELKDLLRCLRHLGRALLQALSDQSAPREFSELLAAVDAVESQRGNLHDLLREIRLSNQLGACKVRGLTRNADSRQAQNLVSRNVDVAEGDLNNKNSLVKAFDGAHGVFLVTDFYRGAGGSVEKEIQQGRNAVDAAQQASVKHLVWSGLEDPRPVAHGALPETQPGRIIPHFESKAEITNMIQKSGLAYTILEPSIFYENAIQTFQFKKQEDGSVAFSLNAGAKAHPQCAVADIGTSAAVAFANFKSYSGAVVPVVGQHITFFKVADVISQMTAQRVQYVPVTRQQRHRDVLTAKVLAAH
ncbi:hypothetical protein WJX84_008639 [Apatococcus fuscideae]|uniref:NmrA-like domain-containing protein n=1 Tax=Apatococcus fuscideae TaxID=2026836 RepID=A0AAW1S2S9_9CHLO